MKFKKFYKDYSQRLITESVIAPEVLQALKEWNLNTNDLGVLIGGLALSYWTKPRYTMDGDFLFKTEKEIPFFVEGFRKIRDHGFEHKKTGVEIEVITPKYLNWPNDLWDRIEEEITEVEGIRILKPVGLAASKLIRGSLKDLGDIEALIESGHEINLNGWPIPKGNLDKAIELGLNIKI